MTLNYIIIGRNIKEARLKKHLSQAQLAELTELSSGYISFIETGARGLSIETFVTLAGVWYVGKVLDLRGETLSHNLQKEAKNDVFSLVGIALLLGAVLFDALKLFGSIQSEEGFDITGIVNADFAMMGIVTLAALVIATILYVIGKKNKKR